jgi:hypothetical protein
MSENLINKTSVQLKKVWEIVNNGKKTRKEEKK